VPAHLGIQELRALKTSAWLAVKYGLHPSADARKIDLGERSISVAEARYEVAKRAVEAATGL
jgi:hypothetical protein